MSFLRHQLLDDGRVLVNAVNGTTHSIHVSLSEAKRFAWSLLNDIDPEGVHKDAVEAVGRPDRAKRGPSQGLQLLMLLSARDFSTTDIADRIGTSRNQAAVTLNRLRTLDLCKVVGVREQCAVGRASNVWSITTIGRTYLGKFSPDHAETCELAACRTGIIPDPQHCEG